MNVTEDAEGTFIYALEKQSLYEIYSLELDFVGAFYLGEANGNPSIQTFYANVTEKPIIVEPEVLSSYVIEALLVVDSQAQHITDDPLYAKTLSLEEYELPAIFTGNDSTFECPEDYEFMGVMFMEYADDYATVVNYGTFETVEEINIDLTDALCVVYYFLSPITWELENYEYDITGLDLWKDRTGSGNTLRGVVGVTAIEAKYIGGGKTTETREVFVENASINPVQFKNGNFKYAETEITLVSETEYDALNVSVAIDNRGNTDKQKHPQFGDIFLNAIINLI